MVSKAISNVNEVFARWQAEDEELGRKVDAIRHWMRELDQLGKQHFGETATRLHDLRQHLVQHFDREEEMIQRLGQAYPTGSPEVTAVQRQTEQDHENLLQRVDDMVERMNHIDPPFKSWQQAMDEVEGLVSLLEQHESSEWDNIEMLLPG